MDALAEIAQKLGMMSPEDRESVANDVQKATANLRWIPNPGPQTEAYFSEAFITLYGGSAGGGKSDLILGLAFNEHDKSLLVRRQYTDIAALTDRAIEINGSRTGYNGSAPPRLTLANDSVIDFGGVKDEKGGDSFQGKARDFLGLDEVAQQREDVVRKLIAWVRSTDPYQRCRVVMGSNPPLSDEGAWLSRWFAPWIEPNHPLAAKDGELRWYITDQITGDYIIVPEPGVYCFDQEGLPFKSDLDPSDDDAYSAFSMTFIRAKLKDNPYLADSGYKQTLDALPPHLQKALRDGEFFGARTDHEMQVIPSDWIRAAQERWTTQPPANSPMCAIGVDIAQGGPDNTVIACRHDHWFNELISVPGSKTPNGPAVAGLIMSKRINNAEVIIDMGGGYGGSTYDQLAVNIPDSIYKWKGGTSTHEKTASGGLNFFNKRAMGFYRLREALDPAQPGGSDIALPPDSELFGQLSSIRFDKQNSDSTTIKLESKVDLVKRIGASPDKADALMMCWTRGPKVDSHYNIWQSTKVGTMPKVNTGSRNATHYSRKR